MAADVLLIDREHLGTPYPPRLVRDFPAASGRYGCAATGYQSLIGNGSLMLRAGDHAWATPGHILRPNA